LDSSFLDFERDSSAAAATGNYLYYYYYSPAAAGNPYPNDPHDSAAEIKRSVAHLEIAAEIEEDRVVVVVVAAAVVVELVETDDAEAVEGVRPRLHLAGRDYFDNSYYLC
jgi:hypothetical protein